MAFWRDMKFSIRADARRFNDGIGFARALRDRIIAEEKYDIFSSIFLEAQKREKLYRFKMRTWKCDIDELAKQLQENE